MLSEVSKLKSKTKENGSAERKGNYKVRQVHEVETRTENTAQHQKKKNSVNQVHKVEMSAEKVQNQFKEHGAKQGTKFKKVKAKKIVKEGDENDTPPDWGEDDECEPMKVVQKGREFYDENGELLFRV